ncbi:unnamed protein product [Fusarium venenatum]|uniref:DNA2/NAM7 helicase-like C-terminal domain-containing protein n=1 Tax=Fusarium venenatum TaxID=56646 RepID=A0A2L2SS17_9HYPO|nr:uncharacterized protein FVRRES_12751 [Fusarium venenatum]CEI40060.1 unnamed protein product [Fusarium venenatum]
MPQQKTKGEAETSERSTSSVFTGHSYSKECVVFFGDCGHILASNKAFGIPTKLTSKLAVVLNADRDPVFRFLINFPLGDAQIANENAGFGVKYQFDHTLNIVAAIDQHTIEVQFPRDLTQVTCDAAPQSVVDRFPNAKIRGREYLTIVRVSIRTPVTVIGFGPFCSPDAEVNGWVNDNQPIGDGGDLQSFLRQNEFTFLLNDAAKHIVNRVNPERLPGLFRFPYGDDQSWDVVRLGEEARTIKGHRFRPRHSHPNDLSLVTALVQGTSQDIMWLEDWRAEISLILFPAYFIPIEDDSTQCFYLIIGLNKNLLSYYDQAWRRLSKKGLLNVCLFESPADETLYERWQAKIMNHPELFLLVRRPVQDSDTNYGHKVTAANLLLHNAVPVNFTQLGLPSDHDNSSVVMQEDDMNSTERAVLANVRDRMDLQRALMRGKGFFEWMSKPETDIEQSHSMALRQLPLHNFLNAIDKEYAEAIIDEALPQDRARFRNYLERRPLGLGIVTGGPGFGKTTIAAAITLAMEASLGNFFASAPTNVAVDSFASRIESRGRAITARYNEGKETMGKTPKALHRLVVRVYKHKDECVAFLRLLENPNDSDSISPGSVFRNPSKWKLHLSSTCWLLMVLYSPIVRPLHPKDALTLHRLQREIEALPDLASLRALAKQEASWEEARKATEEFEICISKAQDHLKGIPARADILCATPAASVNDKRVLAFKLRTSGFAIDEAANMTRTDLLCDSKHPLKDAPAVYINRFALGAWISALEYVQAAGIPTLRLKTQLRMAKGIFDTVSDAMYPEVLFSYHVSRSVEYSSEFKIGLEFESFARARYPDLAPSPVGTLKPFFVHCKGVAVLKDKKSGSKRSFRQVRIALDFILDFVVSRNIDPTRISPITPYAANLDLINRLLKREKYAALSTMPRASTIDSIQGQENDIVVAITGTNQDVGPGFTADPRRLNAMLTRAKCGLAIVGDIRVAKRTERNGNVKG